MSTVDLDPLDLVDPVRFAQRGYPHDVWARLRAEAPVAYVEPPGYKPFWAVTKHADILQVSSQPLRYSNAQGLSLAREGAGPVPPSDMLVLLDPPKHGPMRRVVTRGFTPKAVRAKLAEIERIALDVVDEATPAGTSGDLDVVAAVAAPFPLALIAWILGVPRDDWKLLYRLSNEVIGKDDPEFRRPGETPGQTMKRARGEIHRYFQELVAARRDDPSDDLVSELIAGTVDGEPLTDDQLLLYCELFVEAGNETTRNAISGGLLAFCEHPEQWEKLQASPELLPDAVEEVLRWVSPICYFTRVATDDCELRGQPVRKGEQLALFYASANRDEDVFDDPFVFRVDRRPNPHLAFGFGEHFCIGAHLARVEIETVFRHLLTRLGSFELSGRVERLESAQNGSIKRLPLRYQERRA
jgi:cholest-4-en-3-one 26-monooxygenase